MAVIVQVGGVSHIYAGMAQLAEQLICNQQVVGSSPTLSSQVAWTFKYGLANYRRKEMQTLNFMAECPLNGVRHCDEVGLKYPLSYETRWRYKRSQVGRWIKQREVWHRRTLWEDFPSQQLLVRHSQTVEYGKKDSEIRLKEVVASGNGVKNP